MDFQYWLTNKIREAWNANYLGELVKTDIKFLQRGTDLDFEKEKSSLPIDLLLANIATALSTGRLLGTALESTLKSVKKRLDTSAGYVFANYLNSLTSKEYVAVSEGKDEKGEEVEDPLKKLDSFNPKKYGIAVDVVDGTTLAAKGLDGAYSLSAAANGLISFPDMQAYAVGAPINVLENFNFHNNPEKEIELLVENLSRYYNKPPNELKIVTHSSDTGNHHRTLINNLTSLGVQVIVPEPVIVEPPYVLGMALRTKNAPDCIIGVFGLPEIVINTLLLASIGEEYELRFRIASNSMLEHSNQNNLDDAFLFKKEEVEILKKLNLDCKFVYSKKTIASNLNNICSSSTALTYDPILDIKGFQLDNSTIRLETIFSGYGNNTLQLSTYHKCFNSINYSACYSQKIDDISLILPVKELSILNLYDEIVSELKNITDNGIVYADKKDLHITAYEFGIHYGGCDINEILAAKEEIKDYDYKNNIFCKAVNIYKTNDSIIMNVVLPEDFLEDLNKKHFHLKGKFFNIMKVPSKTHITLARFNKYLPEEINTKITNYTNSLSKKSIFPINFLSDPSLVHITETPFTKEKI